MENAIQRYWQIREAREAVKAAKAAAAAAEAATLKAAEERASAEAAEREQRRLLELAAAQEAAQEAARQAAQAAERVDRARRHGPYRPPHGPREGEADGGMNNPYLDNPYLEGVMKRLRDLHSRQRAPLHPILLNENNAVRDIARAVAEFAAEEQRARSQTEARLNEAREGYQKRLEELHRIPKEGGMFQKSNYEILIPAPEGGGRRERDGEGQHNLEGIIGKLDFGGERQHAEQPTLYNIITPDPLPSFLFIKKPKFKPDEIKEKKIFYEGGEEDRRHGFGMMR